MADSSNQREYWNSISGEKKFTLDLDLISFGALVPEDAAILDYGCGYGRIMGELHEYGYSNIVGVDISPEMVRRAREAYPQLRFDAVDGLPIPYGNDAFDAVLLIGVLTAIPENEDQSALIRELFRVLKPGGFIYVTDFCIQTDERNLKRYKEFARECGTYGVFRLPDGVTLRHHDMDYIVNLLSEFELISLVTVDAVTMNNNPARAFQYFGRKPRNDEG